MTIPISASPIFIPDYTINILKEISEEYTGNTFFSGLILLPTIHEGQGDQYESCHEDINDTNILERNYSLNGISSTKKYTSGFSTVMNFFEKVLRSEDNIRTTIREVDAQKMEFIKNIGSLKKICNHSLDILRQSESQMKIIEEYVYPYQQYNVLVHKLQNGKLSNSILEMNQNFEIVDHSTNFFQVNSDLLNANYYFDNFKKIRLKLCLHIVSLLSNTLNNANQKTDVYRSFETKTENSEISNDSDLEHNISIGVNASKMQKNVRDEENMLLYYIQLKSIGKTFNEYISLLVNRFNATHQNESYKSCLYQLETIYINYRMNDNVFGIIAFKKYRIEDSMSRTKPNSSFSPHIKNFTRLALNYCKYEWLVFNSFFGYEAHHNPVNTNDKCAGSSKNKNVYSTTLAMSSYGTCNEFEVNRLSFASLMSEFGAEYYDKLNSFIQQIHDDLKSLRECILYLSRDIAGLASEFHSNLLIPDSYLSSFLYYVAKLQNLLVEKLLNSLNNYVQVNIEDYEIKDVELNYPNILLNNKDKEIQSYMCENSMEIQNRVMKDSVFTGYNACLDKALEEENIFSTFESVRISKCEDNEILTHVSFPPNTIRLQTNSDSGDTAEDEYSEKSNLKQNLTYKVSYVKGNGKNNQIESNLPDQQGQVNIDNNVICLKNYYGVVNNSFVALSYIYNVTPYPIYTHISSLIVEKCCNKLMQAHHYIANKYQHNKIDKLYHGHLFIIRNLLYLMSKLIFINRQDLNQYNLLHCNFKYSNNAILSSSDTRTSLDGSETNSNSKYTYKYKSTTYDALKITNTILNRYIDELINGICSFICLPLTKIVLQVHPEIQQDDIKELQCTDITYIKDSIANFWDNLKVHINSYILVYLDLYLTIDFSSPESSIDDPQVLEDLVGKSQHYIHNTNLSDILDKDLLSLDQLFKSQSISNSIYSSIKNIIIGSVLFEFDHVLSSRIGLPKEVIERELGWDLDQILGFLKDVDLEMNRTR
ncbi:hypothetical protein cand_000280 [Cryptosporidium andersoni]|uniref:Conserved oligomeric Golgi complex subunit 3 C-terminal domain-containing protein n=1 Tax=Cryptosporidium andersoni TaxID=117008 RepID=A0A1J4MSU9_9CRYT|nr:hypothetical protein cand_000280 [Cryptosporidium andersoni]